MRPDKQAALIVMGNYGYARTIQKFLGEMETVAAVHQVCPVPATQQQSQSLVQG